MLPEACYYNNHASIIHRELARNCSFLVSSEKGESFVNSFCLEVWLFFQPEAQTKQYFPFSMLNGRCLVSSRILRLEILYPVTQQKKMHSCNCYKKARFVFI